MANEGVLVFGNGIMVWSLREVGVDFTPEEAMTTVESEGLSLLVSLLTISYRYEINDSMNASKEAAASKLMHSCRGISSNCGSPARHF